MLDSESSIQTLLGRGCENLINLKPSASLNLCSAPQTDSTDGKDRDAKGRSESTEEAGGPCPCAPQRGQWGDRLALLQEAASGCSCGFWSLSQVSEKGQQKEGRPGWGWGRRRRPLTSSWACARLPEVNGSEARRRTRDGSRLQHECGWPGPPCI
jgi:hypothetical protein